MKSESVAERKCASAHGVASAIWSLQSRRPDIPPPTLRVADALCLSKAACPTGDDGLRRPVLINGDSNIAVVLKDADKQSQAFVRKLEHALNPVPLLAFLGNNSECLNKF